MAWKLCCLKSKRLDDQLFLRGRKKMHLTVIIHEIISCKLWTRPEYLYFEMCVKLWEPSIVQKEEFLTCGWDLMFILELFKSMIVFGRYFKSK